MTMIENSSFSIDVNLTAAQLTELSKQVDALDERIEDIFNKAVVNNYPIARIVLQQFNPTPSDLLMLSKVFKRLSELKVEYDELKGKQTALKAISSNADWIYSSIGSPERDIDLFLHNLNEGSTTL